MIRIRRYVQYHTRQNERDTPISPEPGPDAHRSAGNELTWRASDAAYFWRSCERPVRGGRRQVLASILSRSSWREKGLAGRLQLGEGCVVQARIGRGTYEDLCSASSRASHVVVEDGCVEGPEDTREQWNAVPCDLRGMTIRTALRGRAE